MKMSRSIFGLGVGLMAALVVQAQAPATAPAGTTGLCKDGSYSSGASKQGACRGHKGVKEWYSSSAAAPAVASAVPAKAASHKSSKQDQAAAAAPATMAAGPAPSGATGQCKDGSYSTGASKKGACRGHKGVQEWYGTAASAAAAPASAPRPAAPVTTVAPTAPAAAVPAAAAPAPAAAAPRYTPPAVAAAGGGAGQVWVNTRTKVYHCQGDANYGKTKEGAYMTEAAARTGGDRPARGKTCQ